MEQKVFELEPLDSDTRRHNLEGLLHMNQWHRVFKMLFFYCNYHGTCFSPPV